MRSNAKAATAGSNLRRPGAARLALLCVPALLLAALFAAPAQAAPETIAEFGTGAGQVEGPRGVAIDQSSGDLYVTEGNNFRVSKFDSEGNFLLAFGVGVADGATPVLQTCGPEATPPTTRCFGPNLTPLSLVAESVAVDQASGDVYVSGDRRVAKFTSSGQLVFMVGRNVNETKVALGGGATQAEKNICTASSGDTCDSSAENGTGANEFSGRGLPLAVDSAGVVWVGDTNRIVSFSSAGAPGAEVVLLGIGEIKSLAIDSSHDFYVKIWQQAGIHKLEAGTGALAGVGKCSDAAIEAAKSRDGKDELASPSCPSGSQIGRTSAGAGVGSVLTYVPGRLYLAGPYKGAPLSVVAITPGVAGPFDVGTIVVREALNLSPRTAEVEVDGAARTRSPTSSRESP